MSMQSYLYIFRAAIALRDKTACPYYYTSSPSSFRFHTPSSGVANDGHGLVGFLEILDLCFREFDIDCTCARRRQILLSPVGYGTGDDPTNEVFQFIEGRGADYGGRDNCMHKGYGR